MLLKRITLLRSLACILTIQAFPVLAQQIRVLSSKTEAPVMFAHVVIQPLENKNLKELGLMADTNGVATFPESYIGQKVQLCIVYLGYEKFCETTVLPKEGQYRLKDQAQVLNEVVITGQYAPNSPEKAIQKIRIIDRKKIDAMAAQNLRDVLTNEMNIRLSQDNVLGSSMSMMGVSGENVKILVDGVPVIGRQNGNLDLSQINLNNIERIEVIEGPMSVSYGTNAIAGTINLITRKSQEAMVEGNVTGYYESIGNYNLGGTIGYHKNRHMVGLNVGRNFFDGWNPGEKVSFDNSPQLADSGRVQSWKPKEQYFGDLQYSYALKHATLSYRGSLFNETILNRGYPRAPYGETAFDDTYLTRRIDNAVYLSASTKKKSRINFLAAYNDYNRTKNTRYIDLTTLKEQLSETPGDQDTSRATLFNSRATFNTARDSVKLNYEVGYDINVETGTGQRIKDKKQQIGDYAVFASAEYHPWKAVTLRPGLRYAYNTSYGTPLVPSLHLRVKANKNITVRASYARGFRAPAIKELYFYFFDVNHSIKGNENLKAESSDNYMATVQYSIFKNNKALKAELTGFYNDITNMITLAQVDGNIYTYINIGKYKTTGLQGNIELAVNHLKWSVGGSYIGRYNDLSENFIGVNRFSYTPELRSNIFYEYKKQEMTFGIFYKYTGKLPGYMLNSDNSVSQTSIPGYHTADVSVSKWFMKKRFSLSIGCKNIFNVQNLNSNAVVAGAPHSSASSSISVATGRSVFAKLFIRFNTKK